MISLLILIIGVIGIFGFVETDDSQYAIIDDKQYFIKTIDSRLADLSQQENRYELDGINFYLNGEKTPNSPNKQKFGYKVPVIIEYPDGFTKEILIQTKMTGDKNNKGLDYDFEFYKAENRTEIAIFTGLIQSKDITQFLVFDKIISQTLTENQEIIKGDSVGTPDSISSQFNIITELWSVLLVVFLMVIVPSVIAIVILKKRKKNNNN